jgi:hypothetical protein
MHTCKAAAFHPLGNDPHHASTLSPKPIIVTRYLPDGPLAEFQTAEAAADYLVDHTDSDQIHEPSGDSYVSVIAPQTAAATTAAYITRLGRKAKKP